MITVQKNATRTVKVGLNQDNLIVANPITISFTSPSRTTIELTKTLTLISAGFYSFQITSQESIDFIDDTYSYNITQNEVSLKKGFVRLQAAGESLDLVFDFTLDFTLS